MIKKFSIILACLVNLGSMGSLNAQHSIARKWNEVLLEAIREDFARPTVHARNLFHVSVAMYDAWAAYDDTAETYFLGKTVNGFYCPYFGVGTTADIESERKEAISYACFRLLTHRFRNSPGAETSLARFKKLMLELGYDPANHTLDYRNSGAGLGNYLAEFLINYGLQDGSNEQNGYKNREYNPVNPPLNPGSGNIIIEDPNRWQPLAFSNFIDQSGNLFVHIIPDFVGAEWGGVAPFALGKGETTDSEGSAGSGLYYDPGPPPLLNLKEGLSKEYKWGFSLVALWSSHLDPLDDTYWDISPASMGNLDINSYPSSWADYDKVYNYEGGDVGIGRDINPKTGKAYEPQMVKRGDFTRVLAEFWADGPDSETPPGHWYTILNYVSDQPEFQKKFGGEGEELDDLEWDVMTYFVLGGAMHDAAISAWGIKGHYDYIRPISAIRYMASKGQSTDSNLPNYNKKGMPLIPGHIELVKKGDILEGAQGENVNKIKLYAWKGPDHIENPSTDVAGVGWILAEDWWPYQRPTFVTPPFAGYISGHSTFSRAAAEVMTLLTGDPFFPGGMGEFVAKKNKFLVFEEGPSQDVILQWATYRDASDQCSLSRIWGGIHPPADDLPGRIIGKKIGIAAFEFAKKYFSSSKEISVEGNKGNTIIFPNPVDNLLFIKLKEPDSEIFIDLINLSGKTIERKILRDSANGYDFQFETSFLRPGIYLLRLTTRFGVDVHQFIKK